MLLAQYAAVSAASENTEIFSLSLSLFLKGKKTFLLSAASPHPLFFFN